MRRSLRRGSSSAVLAALLAGLTAACGGGGGKQTSGAPQRVSKTFLSIADAYVRQSRPRVNFGKTTELRVDAIPPARAYLRFRLFGIAGKIDRATLRIRALTTSNDGFQVESSSGGWAESRITFSNAPPLGKLVNISGVLTRDTWKSIDVSDLVRSRTAPVEVALTGIGPTELALASREHGSLAPQLIVESTR